MQRFASDNFVSVNVLFYVVVVILLLIVVIIITSWDSPMNSTGHILKPQS